MPSRLLKFLLDENLHVGMGAVLSNMNHDVRVLRITDPGMKDRDIINLSVQERRVIITQDLDFGELVYRYRLKPEGIIMLRVHPSNFENQKRAIVAILDHVRKMNIDIRGKFVVFHDQVIRVRDFAIP